MSPVRVQRRRTKGWRTPDCSCGCGKPARYVGRGSSWGNPTVIANGEDRGEWYVLRRNGTYWLTDSRARAAEQAVWEYRLVRFEGRDRERNLTVARTELGGHDLMCWCPLDQPCHADVLLELANAGEPS
mgnify:FL=1